MKGGPLGGYGGQGSLKILLMKELRIGKGLR